MTPERARVERDRADQLIALHAAMGKARERLDLINAHIKRGQAWKIELMLKKDEHSNYRNITIEVVLPVEIVQQQAVDAWKAAKRAFVMAGGE